MIEILKGQSERLILHTATDDGPKDTITLPTIEIYNVETGELIIADTAYRISVGEYGYNTPLSLSETDAQYRAIWTFELDLGGVTEQGHWEQLIITATPYTTPAAVRDRYPHDDLLVNATEEEVRDAERTVRYIINSYVGQSFSLEANKTYEVRGRGLKELQLPKRLARLIKIEDLNGRVYDGQIDAYTGFSIRKGDGVLPYSAYTDGASLYGVPIGTRTDSRWDDTVYRVTGDWGWAFIPQEVIEASMLLIKDSFNPDSKYFEMYVDNIRAADWRMEFAKTGDRTTGNAKADLLLSRFHTGNWTLI